jgi:plastocyanin
MQQLGLGITNNNFESFNGTAPARLSGRILIKVEDSGKAYYVNPVDLKLSYLAEPIAALNVLRSFGLGVMNADLGKITIADSASVNITSSGFNPHNLTVKRGAMVVWTNYDSVVHTVTSPKNFDFGDIKPGKTYSRMFNIVGTYNYYCSYHHNLTGTITVK